MESYKQNVSNRVGISAQKSTGVTTVGDGLALRGDKSPVTTQSREENKQEGYKRMNRHEMNLATKLEEFPQCVESYGKERWNKTIQILQKIGFVNWELNTMFASLEKINFGKTASEAGRRRFPEFEEDYKPNKISRLSERESEHETRRVPSVDSHENKIEKTLVPSGNKKTNSTCDLRIHIGDASHPNFYILPCHRTKFQYALLDFVARNNRLYKELVHKEIVQCFFINQLLVVEGKNRETLEFIEKLVSKLDGLWPGARFVLCPRNAGRERLQLCIPYTNLNVDQILLIIKRQNELCTENWNVERVQTMGDEIWMDVDIDSASNLRIMHDQEDIFFLMKRCTIRLLNRR